MPGSLGTGPPVECTDLTLAIVSPPGPARHIPAAEEPGAAQVDGVVDPAQVDRPLQDAPLSLLLKTRQAMRLLSPKWIWSGSITKGLRTLLDGFP